MGDQNKEAEDLITLSSKLKWKPKLSMEAE